MFLGEFTRLSWVRALATAGVCHRCMGGTSGPRLPPWGFRCYSRRCALRFSPERAPPQNRNPSSWLLAISIELDDPLLLAFLAVCSARCPDYDGAAANFAASVNLNTCNALPSSRTHQFLFARPPPCVLLMCCVPWCCARAVVLFQSRVACCFMLVL